MGIVLHDHSIVIQSATGPKTGNWPGHQGGGGESAQY